MISNLVFLFPSFSELGSISFFFFNLFLLLIFLLGRGTAALEPLLLSDRRA